MKKLFRSRDFHYWGVAWTASAVRGLPPDYYASELLRQCLHFDPPDRTVLIRPVISGYPPTLPPKEAAARRRERMERLANDMLAAARHPSRCPEITGPSRRGRMWVFSAALTHFCVAIFLRFVSFQIFVPGNTLTPLINFFPTEI